MVDLLSMSRSELLELIQKQRDELAEAWEDIKCYEGMKEGVGVRISDLEHTCERLRAGFNHSEELRRVEYNRAEKAIRECESLNLWIKEGKKLHDAQKDEIVELRKERDRLIQEGRQNQ